MVDQRAGPRTYAELWSSLQGIECPQTVYDAIVRFIRGRCPYDMRNLEDFHVPLYVTLCTCAYILEDYEAACRHMTTALQLGGQPLLSNQSDANRAKLCRIFADSLVRIGKADHAAVFLSNQLMRFSSLAKGHQVLWRLLSHAIRGGSSACDLSNDAAFCNTVADFIGSGFAVDDRMLHVMQSTARVVSDVVTRKRGRPVVDPEMRAARHLLVELP